jgi:hypothetical protein
MGASPGDAALHQALQQLMGAGFSSKVRRAWIAASMSDVVVHRSTAERHLALLRAAC